MRIGLIALAIGLGSPFAWGRLSRDASYPYGGETFRAFVAESYRQAGAGGPDAFFLWFDAETQARLGATLPHWLAAQRKALDRTRATKNAASIAKAETTACHETWELIKKTLRRFSLDRGFEFTNAVAHNERQCFLQSVLIAGLLQHGGVDAGVAMVWRNPKGQESNLGHAVAIARLASGRDLLVDASDPEPFMRHGGLFLRTRTGYAFVTPMYAAARAEITGYRSPGGATIPGATLMGLDPRFLASQFDFYRGERASGGPISTKPTPQGLAASERHLRSATNRCSSNPLATYVLGLTQRKLGKASEARTTLRRAEALYRKFGWTPESVSRAARE